MSFKVTVIIPVYNAAIYVRNAVESTVNLNEVGEVILIEDKSPDNALEICRTLVREFDKVKLFQHPNGENRGAGASRNLGIKNAKCDFIAFLDADDWYLPNRFQVENKLFTDPTIDGVYSIAQYYSNNEAQFISKYEILKNKLSGRRLFIEFLKSGSGTIATNNITLRKKIFEIISPFNETLLLHQDTELWTRIAFHFNLVFNKLSEPVAIIRLHQSNRISKANFKSKEKLTKVQYNYYRTNAKEVNLKSIFYLSKQHALYTIRKSDYNIFVLFYAKRTLFFIMLFLSFLSKKYLNIIFKLRK